MHDSRPAALIFRRRLLPWSETFIAAQGRAHRRYRPVFTGFELVDAGPDYLGDSDRVILRDHSAVPFLAKGLLKGLGRVPARWLDAMRSHRPAVVHAHFGHNALQAIPVAEALGVPLVVTYWGADIALTPDARGAEHRARVFEHADVVIGCSEFICARLREAGCPEVKIRVHYVGVDTERFRPARGLSGSEAPSGLRPWDNSIEAGPTVLFVGRMVEKKGLRYLIEAMSTVSGSVPGASLLVVGNGPLRADMEQRVRQMDAPVRFLGVLPPDEVAGLMRRVTVQCVPSVVARDGDAEGLPLTIMEAQSTGLPVVASPSGGAAEGVEEGVTGYVVPSGNVEGLADRLTAVLADPDLRERLSQGARARALELFDIAKQTARLEVLYDQARGVGGHP